MSAGIPILDLRRDAHDRDAFVSEVGAGYRQFGFCGFTHHGIDDALIRRAYDAYAAFFALPLEVKQRYHRPGIGGDRGYTGFGVEQAKDHSVPDLKEFWQVGQEFVGDNPRPDIFHANLWPHEVPEFKPASLALFRALEDLGRRVLRAIASSLDLEPDWFDDTIDHGNSILRPLHYPPVPGDLPEGAVRSAQHEDINVITLLVGSDQAGLEVLSRDGDWIPVTTIPGTIVVNIGDMLQRLTNHVLPSTTHRVVNPPGADASESRYSVPFFLHFNPEFVIEPLPQCVAANPPARDPEPITANEYRLQRLREINLL